MSDARKFLTIPSQEALFTVVRNDRSAEAEGCSSPPAEDDEDEEAEPEDAPRLMPRSSPVPRKRGLSLFEETAEYLRMRLAMATRRVSFADTSGGELVEVKEFVAFESDEEQEPEQEQEQEEGESPAESEGRQVPARGGRGGELAYRARADFSVPSGAPALLAAVRANKVELESVSFPEDEPLAFAGLVRVLNVSFHKAVYVRFTMDAWRTFFDVPADYVHGSNDVETDRFSFRLSFAQPYVRAGARIEFVLRFETPQGDYWANNAGSNYSVTLNPAEEEEMEEVEEPGAPPLIVDAPAEKRRGILKASSYRMDTEYEEIPSAEKEEEAQKREMDMKSEPAIACPQIIHPEIDIEIVNAVTLGCQPAASSDLEPEDGMTSPDAESLKEQMRSFSLAKESKDRTVLEASQPLSTQLQAESHQVPDLREDTEVPPGTSTEDDHVASMSDLSCSSCVEPFTGSVDESCAFNIVYSVPGSSFQGAEFVTPTKSTEKVPSEQHATQRPSPDVLEPDEGSRTLDTERVTGERDQMSTMIQGEDIASFGGLNLSETELLRAADSSVPVWQDNESNYQDARICQSTSVHEMHVPLTCLPEELGKTTAVDERSATGEKGIKAADASKKAENVQAAAEGLSGMVTPCMLDTPAATLSGPGDPMFQSQVGPEIVPTFNPLLASFPKRDPAYEMDEPSEVPRSTRPLAESMNFTSCVHREEIRLTQLGGTLEATESPGLATGVSASSAAAVSVTMPTTDIAIQSKNILAEDSEAVFSPIPESTDSASLSTDGLRKEVSLERQRPVAGPLVSQKAESDAAAVRALMTAFVTFAFVVCLALVITDPGIFLIFGLYLLL
ncbi:protein phosphatase 1 regulatory subunit 3A isoform X2 [Scleropages formosus]|uniref:protein phosphatase 1 regulatory subunit 3A isoform X2 n=1 Tax=Scleropages formosus TaxID=113540 RepID=UPI0010FAB751|nr:protein phosphatase 1 regulatory subunit 3F isoform X2 [Scleropages formosus]